MNELYAMEGEFGGTAIYGGSWRCLREPKTGLTNVAQGCHQRGAVRRQKRLCGECCKTLHRSWNLGISVTWGEL